MHKGTGTGGYTYAPDGSMVTDDNENITGTNYNTYLKQPRIITLGDGRSINYKYDGAGNLLRTEYSNGEIWDYVGNLIYKNGEYFSLNTTEGRANYFGGLWNYEYFYTDHLGNTRASFLVENGQITKKSQADFDPLGVKHGNGVANPVTNRFEYQGKEKDLTFGLNWVNLGARRYNGTIGRMDGVDMLADLYNDVSPFNYVKNNPLRFIDPTGLGIENPEFEKKNGLSDLQNRVDQQNKLSGGNFETGRFGIADCPTCPNTSAYSAYRDTKNANYTYDTESGFVLNGDGNGGTVRGKRNTENNCPTCLDPSTIGKNLMGLSYPGGDNPLSYNKKYNYSYVPIDLSEYPAIGHDRRYDNLHSEGLSGLLTDTRAIGADYKFVGEELNIALMPYLPPNQRIHAAGLGIGLGLMALPKTIAKLSTTPGIGETILWYKVSSVGVNNKPSK